MANTTNKKTSLLWLLIPVFGVIIFAVLYLLNENENKNTDTSGTPAPIPAPVPMSVNTDSQGAENTWANEQMINALDRVRIQRYTDPATTNNQSNEPSFGVDQKRAYHIGDTDIFDLLIAVNKKVGKFALINPTITAKAQAFANGEDVDTGGFHYIPTTGDLLYDGKVQRVINAISNSNLQPELNNVTIENINAIVPFTI
jgi:hypothetical protein